MRIVLFGGPGDGFEHVVPNALWRYRFVDVDGREVLYDRVPGHCGHDECPFWFAHQPLLGKMSTGTQRPPPGT